MIIIFFYLIKIKNNFMEFNIYIINYFSQKCLFKYLINQIRF